MLLDDVVEVGPRVFDAEAVAVLESGSFELCVFDDGDGFPVDVETAEDVFLQTGAGPLVSIGARRVRGRWRLLVHSQRFGCFWLRGDV